MLLVIFSINHPQKSHRKLGIYRLLLLGHHVYVYYHVPFAGITEKMMQLSIRYRKRSYSKWNMRIGIIRLKQKGGERVGRLPHQFLPSPFLILNFLGVTLICRTTQVASVQLNKASSAHCIVHPSPQAQSLSVPLFPTLPTSTYPTLSLWLPTLLREELCAGEPELRWPRGCGVANVHLWT